jgi:hypothetical protein
MSEEIGTKILLMRQLVVEACRRLDEDGNPGNQGNLEV